MILLDYNNRLCRQPANSLLGTNKIQYIFFGKHSEGVFAVIRIVYYFCEAVLLTLLVTRNDCSNIIGFWEILEAVLDYFQSVMILEVVIRRLPIFS